MHPPQPAPALRPAGLASPYSTSPAPGCGPGPALRHKILARPDWWRCRLRTPVGDALGTVTGLIMLGTVVTSYEVRLDDGVTLHAWPAIVGPALASPTDPRKSGRLVVIEGGRGCA